MDLADAFDPAHDAAGRRQRSLELYGVDQNFRASDPFVHALHRIVTCAARFTDSDGACVVVWGNDGPIELATTGKRPGQDPCNPHGSNDPCSHDIVLCDSLDRLTHATTATVQVIRSSGEHPTTTVSAAITGHEHAVLGTLTTWRRGDGPVDPDQIWLLEQLGNAAVHALDERRRTLGRRRTPLTTTHRPTHTPDRRTTDRHHPNSGP